MAYGCRIVKGWSSGRGQLMPCSVSWSLYVPFSPCTTKYIDNIEVIQIRGPPDEFILKWPICLYRKIKYVFFLMKDFHPNEIYILWRYSSYCHVDNWPQPKRYQCITDVVNSFWPNKNLLVKGLFKGHVLHVFFFENGLKMDVWSLYRLYPKYPGALFLYSICLDDLLTLYSQEARGKKSTIATRFEAIATRFEAQSLNNEILPILIFSVIVRGHLSRCKESKFCRTKKTERMRMLYTL